VTDEPMLLLSHDHLSKIPLPNPRQHHLSFPSNFCIYCLSRLAYSFNVLHILSFSHRCSFIRSLSGILFLNSMGIRFAKENISFTGIRFFLYFSLRQTIVWFGAKDSSRKSFKKLLSKTLLSSHFPNPTNW